MRESQFSGVDSSTRLLGMALRFTEIDTKSTRLLTTKRLTHLHATRVYMHVHAHRNRRLRASTLVRKRDKAHMLTGIQAQW